VEAIASSPVIEGDGTVDPALIILLHLLSRCACKLFIRLPADVEGTLPSGETDFFLHRLSTL